MTTKQWYSANTGNHQGLIIDQETGANIAVCYDKAHADLIASAPELLAALQMMLDADNAICENIGLKSDQAMQRIAAIDNARAIIAKAKGE